MKRTYIIIGIICILFIAIYLNKCINNKVLDDQIPNAPKIDSLTILINQIKFNEESIDSLRTVLSSTKADRESILEQNNILLNKYKSNNEYKNNVGKIYTTDYSNDDVIILLRARYK